MAGYTNLKQVLVAGAQLPIAIEAKLPAGAPKVSTGLLDVATKMPAVPDFPVEVPELPAVPELPELPAIPGLPLVTSATVTPVTTMGLPVVARRVPTDRGATYQEYVPSPYVGVMPEVVTRRGM